MTARGGLFFAAGFTAALAAGWLGFPALLYERVEQPLQFSHAVHGGEGAGLSCADCHVFEADGRFGGIPALEKCAACHQEVLGESPDEKRLVAEHVRTGREIPWLVYARQPDNVRFPHAPHVTVAAIPCERCHGPHGASGSLRPFERNRITGYSRDVWGRHIGRVGMQPWEGSKMTDCSACHRERGSPLGCLDCHK